jgi:hypothetical protein
MMINYILSSIAQYENFYYYLLRSFVRLLYYDNIPYTEGNDFAYILPIR